MSTENTSGALIKALLFDLGGVVLKIDPRRVFEHWARASGVPLRDLSQQWGLDEAYKAHEIGAIDFAEYCEALSTRLGLTLPDSDWLAGWNALFTGTFDDVARLLPPAADLLPLYGYTNTNPTHQAAWQQLFGATLTPFRKIYVSSEIGRRKPDVASFQWVADDMGVEPTDIMFLDDSAENIAGAARAGMQTTHVTGPAVTVALLRRLTGDDQ